MLKEQIVEEIELLSGSVQISTPSGWRDILCAFKTIPLPMWQIDTATASLEAAAQHLVRVKDSGFLPLQDIDPGDEVMTEAGWQIVTRSADLYRTEACYDFSIDSPEHTYFSNGILSHNSTTLVARQRIYADIFPHYHSLYIASHTNYLKQYADRFKAMENKFRFKKFDHRFRENLHHKEYSNGSVIDLIRVYLTPDPSRGYSADSLLYDESQHFDPEFEAEVNQTLKASKFPTKYYAGTSLTLDTFLEAKFQAASQGFWFVPTTDNTGKKTWINTGKWEEIQPCIKPEGLMCPYTGNLLRVEDGEYVHASQELYDRGITSFHVPQIIVPEYVSNFKKWSEIYSDYTNYTEAKFRREVMGDPTEEGFRELTLDQLKAICCLPDTIQGLEEKARKGYYRYVVSGCDWGGSEFNVVDRTKVSYTVHVVLGVNPDKDIDVLHMKRYAGMDYDSTAAQIIRDHVRLKGNIMASDQGVGAAYNKLLRDSGQIRPDKHLILRYTAPNTLLFGRPPEGTVQFNEFTVNRTEAITTLFTALKQQPPRIRCYAWHLAQPMLMDFMNVYRNLVETEQGTQKFRYRRHGSKPDDTLHAINFAYVAARVALGEPLIADRLLMDNLRQMLNSSGHIPGSAASWGFGG